MRGRAGRALKDLLPRFPMPRFRSGPRFGVVGLLPVLFLAMVLLIPASGCGDSTGPESNACDDLSFSRRAEVGLAVDCSSVEFTVSDIRYDQFGRHTSYNFEARCVGSSGKTYNGRVFDIRYNSIGDALSWEVDVNGKRCSYPRSS